MLALKKVIVYDGAIMIGADGEKLKKRERSEVGPESDLQTLYRWGKNYKERQDRGTLELLGGPLLGVAGTSYLLGAGAAALLTGAAMSPVGLAVAGGALLVGGVLIASSLYKRFTPLKRVFGR